MAPNDIYICRTAQLTSRHCILNIYPTNILTEYFKHAAHTPFFFSPLQDAVYFITLTFLVPVIFTFYIQGALNFKENSDAKRLSNYSFRCIKTSTTLPSSFRSQFCHRIMTPNKYSKELRSEMATFFFRTGELCS